MSTTPLPDDVSVLIDGQEFRYWSEIELHFSVDSYSTCGFTAPFEVDRQEFREIFRPFSFKPLEVRLGGKPLFTGTLVEVSPKTDPTSSTVDVTGYALPAVFNDCNIPSPSTARPLEFKKIGLGAIAKKLGDPFGIGCVLGDPEGAIFEKVAIKIDQTIQDFLVDLARQRNLVISNTARGELLFWKSVKTGSPVARLAEGVPPVTSVGSSFKAQEYFSEITGFATAKRRKRGARWTEQNPWLDNPLRPNSFKLEDTDRGDAPDATRAKLGRMFANMACFTLDDLPTWRDPKGDLWTPNTTLTLVAPNAFIYYETELLIREVTLRRNSTAMSASLNLVLPGAFSGETPNRLPWI